MRTHRGKIWAVVTTAMVVVGSGLMTPVVSATVTTSGVAAPMPSATYRSGSPAGSLSTVSCPAIANCVALGNYTSSSNATYSMVDALSGSTWTSTELIDSSQYDLAFPSVSCPAVGNCVAVGTIQNYNSPNTTYDAAMTLSSGTWNAVSLPLPHNASTFGVNFNALSSVSCTSVGNCVAVGRYQNGGQLLPLIETETAGVWSGTEAPLTSDQNVGNYNDNLTAVSCWSAGNCVAVGYFTNATTFAGLIERETGGVWSATSAPTTSGQGGTSALVKLTNVSCPAGACLVTGTFNSGTSQGLYAATAASSTWAPISLPLPANAVVGAGANSPSINKLLCTSPAHCLAVGAYQISGGTTQVPLIESDTVGLWKAIVAPQPAGTNPDTVTEQLISVSCVSVGNCVAVGTTTDSAQSAIPLIDVLSGSTWSLATYTVPPSTSGFQHGHLLGVSCVSTGACVSVGDGAGQPLVENIKLPPAPQSFTVSPFAFNSAVISPTLATQVLKAAYALKSSGDKAVACVGYSDNRQSPAISLAISKSRALAVVAKLRADLLVLKVTGVVIVANGVGQASPVASNATAAGQAANRRVVVTIS